MRRVCLCLPKSLSSVFMGIGRSDYPDVVEDRDVYPTEVAEQNLQLVYYGEQLIDVLSVALEEKLDASLQDVVDALNYYSQHDSFMPFDDELG